MKKATKQKVILISVIALVLFGIAYFGTRQSIQDYSSNFYSKIGDGVVLSENRGLNMGIVTGYSAVGVDAGGRNWIKNWEAEGKELESNCKFHSILYNKFSGQNWLINTQGQARQQGDDLICENWIIPEDIKIQLIEKPSNYRYSQVTVRWDFTEPEKPITVYRLEDNQCNAVNILSSEMKINDYNTVERCQQNIIQEPVEEPSTEEPVECNANIECQNVCGDKIPTCELGSCYCSGQQTFKEVKDTEYFFYLIPLTFILLIALIVWMKLKKPKRKR